ncbi:hypothetical protein [Nocardioides sp. YIM 152315]|uniref:Rieske (2Fe-2S) protein n=1 Tax=Nocardioides sp. YIM 152315 TaxID=3031760 RepID=UPI0023DBED8C|nr:hypothetical protein [Nocardioides sp. YIM 152315]MDF1602672.1 hypothetical protein [Nocardioides sp. YIM 152315]
MQGPLDSARLSRRRTLGGAAVAGVAVPLLAACGDDGGDAHGSRFSIEDGSVANGPASSPLEEVPVAVQGGTIGRA